ncbi:MAG: hypothetical protein RIM80_20975, partial [Alphaproteobacteria bacterium]
AATIRARRPLFGPQPFLAIKARDGAYYHDALDWTGEPLAWRYVFDRHTLPLDAIEAVGVGAADPDGWVSVARWRAADGRVERARR